MEFGELIARATAFRDHLKEVKAATPPPHGGAWYPPMLPGHIELLERLLVGELRDLLRSPEDRRIADVGAADGDLGFFLETVGFEVDIFDGARRPQLLAASLGSQAELGWVDLDHDFELPRRYDLVFLLHVVYHLRNPMLTLETLARYTDHCVVSTRVSNHLGGGRRRRRDVTDAPVAYLLDAFELNPHDPHNYWIFSEAGFLRLVSRCGWEVLNHFSVGNPKAGPGELDQPVIWCALRSTVAAAG